MSNREKYDSAFIDIFMLESKDLPNLKYQTVDTWDSVGHMALMAALEAVFEIELDIDDIIDFSSYEVGQTILGKYNIIIESAV